ncbi:ATP-dependent DNA helicase Q4 [Adelges cooleyi]|uniref:ATP-dependent DNA helicase Q4 n=1 Tax=Adelges cooleyi TaxID=133065 RepID=UPI00217FDCCC|nr:ATP-dependent DNA helicase Q4 [Adelges cooleyi]
MEINDPYVKYKFIVKKWENNFIKSNSRNPGKEDIKLADEKVKYAYKMYWKIKTSLLEKSLLGGLDDVDDATIDESMFLNNTNEPSTGNELSVAESSTEVNKSSVWGEHLSIKSNPVKQVVAKPVDNSVSVKYSKKLFDGCDFKKRNPRKSLIKKKSNELNCSQILTEEVTNVQEDSAFHDDSNLSAVTVDSDVSINSTVKVSNISSFISQPLSMLQKNLNTSEQSPKLVTIGRKIDEGWLERCNENNSKVTNLNVVEHASNPVKETESDTDIIYESDNETQDIPLYSSQRIKAQEVNHEISESCNKEELNMNSTNRSAKKRYNSDDDLEDSVPQSKLTKYQDNENIKLSKKDNNKKMSLENKVSSGKASENFVRLDMKRKIYSRGKRSIKTTTYKKKQWKNRKKELGGDFSSTERSSLLKCFKCGDVGHYSKNCLKSNELIPLEDIEEDESPFLTLEEAKKLAVDKIDKAHSKKWNNQSIIQAELNQAVEQPQPSLDDPLRSEIVHPVYDLRGDKSIIDTPDEVYKALELFGHKSFRPGQEKAIMRVLSGLSTLVTLSTGTGKSLCYQLPAYLYHKKTKCITLVVSPLISLMEDQVGGVNAVNLACLHNNQTPKERDIIIERMTSGELSILLVSPEAIVSGFNTEWLSKLPPIAFACLDEAHCLSQWSHNFRPSYLMICQVLREKFGVKTLLGLTATATISTVSSIASELKLDDSSDAVIKDTPLPDNLLLSISRDKGRDNALISLLNGERFKNCNSIIIYCIRREECERIASCIRTTYQSQHTNNGKRGQLSQIAEPYHAGLTAARRKRTQKQFMDGHLKIVVATVAFGMGINKSDLQGIIHYNMAKSLESYVQEIGRAGRDGNVAHCHMFLESEGNDIAELSRHIYANSVDRAAIRKLLERVFVQCKCKGDECTKHEVAFEVEDTVSSLDMKQENIQTLLCYLELDTNKLVKNLPLSYIQCKITSYKGPAFLKQLSKTCPPLAVAYALKEKSGKSVSQLNQFDFSIFEVAAAIGWDSGIIKKELKNLEWSNKNGKYQKSGVSVEFSCLGFRVLAPGNMTAEQLDSTLCNLYQRTHQQEAKSLAELQFCFETFMSVSTASYSECCDDVDIELCEKLKKHVRFFFTSDNLTMLLEKKHDEVILNIQEETRVASDVNRLYNSYIDCKFTARAMARIFHGVESPNFPAYVWGRSPFWRSHIKTDFNAICKIAQKQIISRLK